MNSFESVQDVNETEILNTWAYAENAKT